MYNTSVEIIQLNLKRSPNKCMKYDTYVRKSKTSIRITKNKEITHGTGGMTFKFFMLNNKEDVSTNHLQTC